MEQMIEVVAVAMMGALCTLVVRRQTAEIGLVLALGVGALIITLVLGSVEEILNLIERLSDLAGLSPTVLSPVIKTIGIAIVTRLTVELCKDTGEGGIAAFVEMAGMFCGTVVAIPLLEAVLDMVIALL